MNNLVDRLLEALRSESVSTRTQVATVLGDRQELRAVPELIRMLSSPEREHSDRWHAAKALGQIGDSQAAEPLLNTLKDPRFEVREITAWALGELYDASVITPLMVLYYNEDEDSDVRSSAAQSLMKLDSELQEVDYLQKLVDLDLEEFWDVDQGTHTFKIINCTGASLEEWPTALRELYISDCPDLNAVQLPDTLVKLSIHNCPGLSTLPALPKLESLDIRRCDNLVELPELPDSLKQLRLHEMNAWQQLPALPKSLLHLYLYDCQQLERLPEIPRRIESLNLGGCTALSALPPLPSLLQIDLSGCSGLTLSPELLDTIKTCCSRDVIRLFV